MTLISCIMPTTIMRRAWIPFAIDCWLSQSYKQTELIVGGDSRVAALLPDNPRIHFVKTPNGISIGAKRNMLNEHARGELIAHWDDDDWYAPWRLATQLGALLESGGKISGNGSLVFYDIHCHEFWLYQSPALDYACGATLVYERSLWESRPFEDMRMGEDSRWCSGQEIAHTRGNICIATTHIRNTCKRTYVEPCWRKLYNYVPPPEARDWVWTIRQKVDR
jgi:hypothetical protein